MAIPNNCTLGYGTRVFINATQTCVCATGYTGTLCESAVDWYFDTVTFLHAFHATGLILALLWAIVLLSHPTKRAALKNLAGATLGLSMTSGVLRVIWLVIPSSEITRFYNPTLPYAYFYAALSALAPVLLLAASALVMAFWYDTWTTKLKSSAAEYTSLTRRSKILLIGMAVIGFVAASIGIFMLVPLTSFLLIFLPLCLDILLLATYTGIIYNFDTKQMSYKFREKHRWASRVFVIIVVAWTVYTLSLCLQILDPVISLSTTTIICHILYRTLEPTVALAVMALVDPYAHVLRLTAHRVLPCLNAVDGQALGGTTTSSGGSGSGSSEKATSSAMITPSASKANNMVSDDLAHEDDRTLGSMSQK